MLEAARESAQSTGACYQSNCRVFQCFSRWENSKTEKDSVNILNGLAPVYLKDIVEHYMYKPKCQLCSENKLLLDVPSTRLNTFGDRAFFCFGPTTMECFAFACEIFL